MGILFLVILTNLTIYNSVANEVTCTGLALKPGEYVNLPERDWSFVSRYNGVYPQCYQGPKAAVEKIIEAEEIRLKGKSLLYKKVSAEDLLKRKSKSKPTNTSTNTDSDNTTSP